MPLLRIRINGSDDDLRAIADLLQSVEGIEHVEEISDLMPHMDDDDSSSAGLSDGFGGGIHELEVDAPNDYTAGRVRQAVEELAYRLGLLAEFVEDEDYAGTPPRHPPRVPRRQRTRTSCTGLRASALAFGHMRRGDGAPMLGGFQTPRSRPCARPCSPSPC